MVGAAVHRDVEYRLRESFYHVAGLEVVLTVSIGRQPPRSYVMNVIARHERIVINLGDFVTNRSHVLEAPAKDPRTDPTRIVQDITLFQIAVVGISRLVIVRV